MATYGRKPKDTSKFLHPLIAGTRLLSAASEHVLWNRHGTRVRWTLKVEFYHEPSFKPGKDQIAVPGGFTMSSGDSVPADVELALTGHARTESTSPSTTAETS